MLCISRMHRGSSRDAILHQSTVMQFGIHFIGLLADLPAILDSFFNNTISDFIGVVGWGWWGATKWLGKTLIK